MSTLSLIKRSHSILAALTLAAGFIAVPQWANAQGTAASAAAAAPDAQPAPVAAAPPAKAAGAMARRRRIPIARAARGRRVLTQASQLET